MYRPNLLVLGRFTSLIKTGNNTIQFLATGNNQINSIARAWSGRISTLAIWAARGNDQRPRAFTR